MEPVRIEPTSLAQVPGYHAALDQVARERRFLTLLAAPSLTHSMAFVRAILGGAGVHYIALTAAGEVVGWCDIARNGREGFTHSGQLGMGVLASYRRQGIGRRLLDAALEGARAAGILRVELEVFRSNGDAVRLYESAGFQHEGIKRSARILDGVPDDIVIMARMSAP
jgi:ribosomal protein S18 acetylase RimI-like enzyme